VPDSSQKTEQPTQKRLRKAREDGQFATSNELIGAIQFLAAVAFLGASTAWFHGLAETFRRLLQEAFRPSFGVNDLWNAQWIVARDVLAPLGAAGLALAAVTLGAQLAITQFGFSAKRLAPNFKKLNPAEKLKQLPRENLFAAIQVTVVILVSLAVLVMLARSIAPELYLLPLTPLPDALRQVLQVLMDLLWKAAMLLAVFGAIDYYRKKRKHDADLKMSKEEIRQEFKEAEGDPFIKQRVRSLQRAMRQRKMIQEIPSATVVVVNPTHYAIAIRYQLSSASAPMVVAKGRNLLALRIRRIAAEHGVPIYENPPLARAMYDAVGVGGEIPAHLYRAVAEVLAFVFRASQESGRRREFGGPPASFR
jgi:flagellar biosynthetic protein FlhB